MSLRDWQTLWLLRRAHARHVRHVRTDPACIEYREPKPKSRLDHASRGVSCWQCTPPPQLLVGRCGEWCALPAGHGGHHRSDNGTEWGPVRNA
jgi:hypothetical protein